MYYGQFISQRLSAISESQTLAMASKARALEVKGVKVIKLNLGEPDFVTPDHIRQAAKEAIDAGYTSYSPVPGYPDLVQAIVDKFKRENQLEYKAENIVISTGAKHAIANVLLAILDKDDEVIVFSPYWVSYADQVKLAEGKPVFINGGIENDFKVSTEQLRKAISPKTKAILFSSPCNPSGAVFSKEELDEIAHVMKEHKNIVVISDEIYEHIVFDEQHHSIASNDHIKDRVVVVNGVSKGFAMTGWRIGYIAAPLEIAKACKLIQGQMTSGACTIAQKAAVAALNGNMKPTENMKVAYLRRRDIIIEHLSKIDGINMRTPKGTFYVFPDLSHFFGMKTCEGESIENAEDMAMYLLNKAHVYSWRYEFWRT